MTSPSSIPGPTPKAPTPETQTRQTPWSFLHSEGSAIEFHHRPLPELGADAAEAWIHRSTRPAIVLGSAQPLDLIDAGSAEAAGWEVGRRRSGGGLVVVVPGTHLWVDLLIGPAHPLWVDDVHRAFDWVGKAWADTIRRRTGITPQVHRGPLLDAEAGRLLCFAGLGSGEIVVDGHKVVGLSQRRTRSGARFQTMLELGDHSPLLLPHARGPLREALEARAEQTPPRGIGLPAGHKAIASLGDLEPTLQTLLDALRAGRPTSADDVTRSRVSSS